ncbi:MAG TPA: RHS repeat domain-containing protein, partial [Burkholderiaceae bacterium]
MVAVVSSNTFGLSAAFGGNLLGSSVTGANGQALSINALRGNLILQGRDAALFGPGHDLEALRTYNSQGTVDGDNDDGTRTGLAGWLKSRTGAVNTAGSSVVLVKADGAEEIYTYSGGKYVSSARNGATDTLTCAVDAAGQTWTWQEADGGAGRALETYRWDSAAATGRLIRRSDAEGNLQTYSYDSAGMLNRVTMGTGEYIELAYAGTRLDAIRACGAGGALLSSTTYGYDGLGRLDAVIRQWNEGAASKRYEVRYTYDLDSKRISSLREIDAGANQNVLTHLAFTYAIDGDGNHRVATVTDVALNRITSFT